MIDSNLRIFCKSISWRTIAFIVLSFCSFFVINSFYKSLFVSIIYNIVQIFVFIFHEKIWNYIKWGRTKGLFIQMTGLSGAGKTTLAFALKDRLEKKGFKVEVIDGDEYRENLCKDLTFSKEDRNTNIRRLGFVANVLSRNNVISILSAINPYQQIRQELKNQYGAKLIYVNAPLETVIKRDTKGLYEKAINKKILNFTGISDTFETPENVDLEINTDKEMIFQSLEKLEKFVLENL